MTARAIVIGSTGLVGAELLELLLEDARFDRVVSLVRRSSGRSHAKLEEHVVDFRAPEKWASLVTGDVLFSSLGTTIKVAGSKEAQYEVDYTFQYRVAEAAAKMHVGTYVLVSSTGASPDASMFYSRMKGELERDVSKLAFTHVRILRPSVLKGKRAVPRPGERLGEIALSALRWIPSLHRLRPIAGNTVAEAMVRAWAESTPDAPKIEIFDADEVHSLAAGRTAAHASNTRSSTTPLG